MPMPGDVVELVDTLGLEPSAARRGGSTPSIPTNICLMEKVSFLIDCLHIKKNNYHLNNEFTK